MEGVARFKASLQAGQEVTEGAAAAPVLGRFARLASFFGTGRRLTQAGHPTLADARSLVELLGLPDRLDPEVGGKVFRTRSAGELTELSFSITWAQKAGALRKLHGKLAATEGWAKLADLERFRRAAQALVALGPLAARRQGHWPAFVEMAKAVDETFPSLLVRLADGALDEAKALDELFEHMQERYRWGGMWAEPAHLRRELGDCLSESLAVLEVAGIVERKVPPAGPTPTGEGAPSQIFTLTPAGSWVVGQLAFSAPVPEVYEPVVASSGNVYELRVSLNDIDPPIWRELAVPSKISLASLHMVLQAAMGWTGSHLHMFNIAGSHYGQDYGEDWPDRLEDERRHRLEDVVSPGDEFCYEYDFGDGWEHTVRVLSARQTEEPELLPRCSAGARACPPEDCGGVPGYESLLEALSDPSHKEHDSYLEWTGGGFDPEHFDLAEVNGELARLRVPSV
jgi:hypothetical protein